MLRIAEGFGARIVDSSESSFVFEVTESTEKVDQFLANLLLMGIGSVRPSLSYGLLLATLALSLVFSYIGHSAWANRSADGWN